MCRQSLLSTHERQVLREKCVSVKKIKKETIRKTEREVVGDKGGFQRRRAHFDTKV